MPYNYLWEYVKKKYKQHKNCKIILTTRKHSLYFAFTVLLTLGIRGKKSLSYLSSVILHTKPFSWTPRAKQKGMTEKHLESGNKSGYKSVGRTCTWQESTKAAQNSGFSYIKYNSCFVLLLSIYIFFFNFAVKVPSIWYFYVNIVHLMDAIVA